MRKVILTIMVVLLMATMVAPDLAFSAADTNKEKITKDLTRTFQADGWKDFTFVNSGQDTVTIRHPGFTQDRKLNDGEMTSALGAILTPKVVSKLKKAGFKKGIFIDGKERKYPIQISTKYYNQLAAVLGKISTK